MYLVLLAAAVAILAGVVAVAMGWGGEMAASTRDLPALRLRARTAADVARLRLPVGAFGYQREATDEALHAIAGLVATRDAEIAGLRQELFGQRVQRAAGETAGLPGVDPVAAAQPVAAAAESAESAMYEGTFEAAEPVEAPAFESPSVESLGGQAVAADPAQASEPGLPVSEPAGTGVAEIMSGHRRAAGQQAPSSS